MLPAFGSRRVGSISYGDADRFVRAIEELGRKPGTVRNAFFVLKITEIGRPPNSCFELKPCSFHHQPTEREPDEALGSGLPARS